MDIVPFAKRNISRIAWALIVYELVFQVLGTVIVNVVSTMPLSTSTIHQAQVALNGFVQYAAALPAAYIVLKPVPAMRVKPMSFKLSRYVSLLIMCYPVMVVGAILGDSLSSFLSSGQAENRIGELLSGQNIWWTALWVGILAPIFEELLFRKLLIDRLRGYGEKMAIVLSAAAFGLFHMNLYQFFYAFGLGLLLGYMYMRTSKLSYSIIAHMIINLSSSLLVPLLLQDVDISQLEATLSNAQNVQALSGAVSSLAPLALFGLVRIILTITGVVLLIVQRKRFVFFQTPWQLPKGSAGTALTSFGVVLYTILGVAATVIVTIL